MCHVIFCLQLFLYLFSPHTDLRSKDIDRNVLESVANQRIPTSAKFNGKIWLKDSFAIKKLKARVNVPRMASYIVVGRYDQHFKNWHIGTVIILLSILLIFTAAQDFTGKRLSDLSQLIIPSQENRAEFELVRPGHLIESTGLKENYDTAISDHVVKDILKKLARFEKDFSFLEVQGLRGVADHLNTNTAYLSRVINTYKGVSFTIYLNELKINYAIGNLSLDKHLHGFTIRAISQEYGFSNPEKFSKLFKEKTGVYPSEYLRKQK